MSECNHEFVGHYNGMSASCLHCDESPEVVIDGLGKQNATLLDALWAVQTDARHLRRRYPDDAFVEAIYCNSKDAIATTVAPC